MKPQYPDYGVHVLVTTESGHTFMAKRLCVDDWPCWVTATEEDEQHCPYCWSNGVCWACNDAGEPSSPVVKWENIDET